MGLLGTLVAVLVLDSLAVLVSDYLVFLVVAGTAMDSGTVMDSGTGLETDSVANLVEGTEPEQVVLLVLLLVGLLVVSLVAVLVQL